MTGMPALGPTHNEDETLHLVAFLRHLPKLTDAERHKRFVDMAREVEVDESPEAFGRAFERVISSPPKKAS